MILLQTEPVYSLILSVVVVGERPSPRQLLATGAILAASDRCSGPATPSRRCSPRCSLFITPFFWQTSHVLGLRVMPPLTPISIAGARFIFAACVFIPMFLLRPSASLAQLADPRLLMVILATGFFVYFLSALTWYGAISRLSLSWTTALVVPGIPLISMVFAMIFLGEHPTSHEVIGVLIAIGGVLALVLGADPHRKVGGDHRGRRGHPSADHLSRSVERLTNPREVVFSGAIGNSGTGFSLVRYDGIARPQARKITWLE